MLEKQVMIYSVDTEDFYSKHEAYLHNLNHKLRSEKNQLINGAEIKNSKTKKKRTIVGLKYIEKTLLSSGIEKETLKLIEKGKKQPSDYSEDIENNIKKYLRLKKLISLKNQKIKNSKEILLSLLSNKVEVNIKQNGKHHVRTLNENCLSDKKIISVFESAFTRTINANPDELSEDFIVVQVFYFSVIKDLIYNGFTYKGEKYIYFTSSAGQIRTKKCVFVKESVWKKYEKTLMCGLTIEDINKNGGINTNKFLAYMALSNSATDEWQEFDIDKTIVIDDFETNVFGIADFIDDKDYSITRKSDYFNICHTDGCGMILPNAFGKKQKNMMIRLPFVKGLISPFPFDKFISKNKCSPIIKDIYGIEHDVIAENIQVIFTKSQFKLAKYYTDWQEYKYNFKKYNCSAGYTNIESDRIKNATINYQMLQSLIDISDDEIFAIAEPSIKKLRTLCDSVQNIKNVFGITSYNQNKTALQKAIEIYPELLNDVYIRSKLKDIKDSLIKKYRSGKLQVNGKYTFILPDLYAACEYWFLKDNNPKGLLNDGEVFCWLFRQDKELDCLRSPHLYMEHAIRKNVINNEIREWFNTNALYTSCHDMVSRVLQADFDGDTSLVVADKTLIEVAKRNIQKFDVVPLYYEAKKALPQVLNNENIYNGLNIAFTGSNIGQYSNNISKIWNSNVFISGNDENKKEAIDVIKLLCAENNFCIDRAKTLYMPERPTNIHKKITSFTQNKLPHFFKYAKDKEENQVENANGSFVNKFEKIIPNPRINCKYLNENGKYEYLNKPNYKLLMNNPDIEVKIVKSSTGRLIEGTNPVILKYIENAKMYGERMSNVVFDTGNSHKKALYNSNTRTILLYNNIIKSVKFELLQFRYLEIEVVDILVKYLYDIKQSKHKDLLWICFGDIIYNNLSRHKKRLTKDIECIDCGNWFEVGLKDNNTCRCKSCREEYIRKYYRENKRKSRAKIKMSIHQNNLQNH